MKKILLPSIITLVVLFVCSLFIYPEANKDYTGFWYGGITGGMHGALLIPNWLISFFDETRLVKATNHGSWYNINWWIWAAVNLFSVVLQPIYKIISTK